MLLFSSDLNYYCDIYVPLNFTAVNQSLNDLIKQSYQMLDVSQFGIKLACIFNQDLIIYCRQLGVIYHHGRLIPTCHSRP
jgi:hypothetical protein